MKTIILSVIVIISFSTMKTLTAASPTSRTPEVLSEYFTRDIGDFSHKQIVAHKYHSLQVSLEEVKTQLISLTQNAPPPSRLDLSYCSIHQTTFKSILAILSQQAEELRGKILFFDFSSNFDLQISDKEKTAIDAFFQNYPDSFLDISGSKLDPNVTSKLNSDLKLIYITEDQAEKELSEESSETDQSKSLEDSTRRPNSTLQMHRNYFAKKKLGKDYWKGTKYEAYSLKSALVLGNEATIKNAVSEDITVVDFQVNDCSLSTLFEVANAYLIGEKLKYKPIRAFLILEYILAEKKKISADLDSLAVSARWLLGNFYENGLLVEKDEEYFKELVDEKVIISSSKAQELLELDDELYTMIPDSLTESDISLGSYDHNLPNLETLERDLEVFSPLDETPVKDVYAGKTSATLLNTIRIAVQGKSAHTAFKLGRYYISGRNMKRNLAKAYLWLNYAVKEFSKDKDAKYIIDAKKYIIKIEEAIRKQASG